MHSLNPLYPVAAVIKAVTFPIRAVFVVGLCWFINTMTSPHTHWWHWVAFGMTIGLVVTWLRALRILVEAAGVAGVGYLVYRWWTRRADAKARAAGIVDA